MDDNKDNDHTRNWNIFSLIDTDKWKRFFHLFKSVVTPRFLYEIIIPQDILNVIKEIKFSDGSKLNKDENLDPNVFRFILAAAIFNGVLIGMPGTIGWGVLAAQAVEVLMAIQIARMVGLLDSTTIFSFTKIIKFFSAGALAAVTVVFFFKKTLGIIFNIMGTFVPYGFTTLSAEIVTTLFYGLFLYLSFIEINKFEGLGKNNSTITFTMLPRLLKNAGDYTVQISKSLFKLIFTDTPRLLNEIKQNVQDTWNGVVDVKARVKGEVFLAGCLAYLLDQKYEHLRGPFASLWLQSWREAFPNKLNETSGIEEIRALADSYGSEELARVISNNIHPKFFEILETTHENADGDEWSAELIGDQNNPVSDALFFNSENGKAYEINYKFTESESYIESHIQKHPDVPVIATPDVAEKINSPLVIGGHHEYDTVIEISENNFEQLLIQKHSLYLEAGAATAGSISLAVHMLPFFVAYYRGKITRVQLGKALKQFLPEITGRTINRIAMLSILGPVYATFLIASFAGKATLYGFEEDEEIPETSNDYNPPEEPKKKKKKFSRRDLITLSFLKEFQD